MASEEHKNSIFENDESTFRIIFHSSNEGIVIANDQGTIELANPNAEKMFGYEAGGLQGLKIEDLVPPKYKSIHVHHRKVYNKDPHPRTMGEGRDLTGLRKNGTIFPLEVSLSHVTILEVGYVVAFVIDITERKKVEEALIRSEEQLITYATELENRVRKRTEDLDRIIGELEKSNIALESEIKERKKAEEEAKRALEKQQVLNELKSRFVSMASHEFRTPLSTILSSISLVEKYREKGDLDKIDKHTERVRSAVKNLTSILDDFLSLGRLEEGRVETRPERFNLTELIQKTLEEMESFKKTGQTLIFEASGEVIIYSDPKMIHNIVINLTSNAIKYSPESKAVQIRLKEEHEHVRIQIKDQGMGIPEEDKEHMFERFFRAKNATNIQGTGLGLNIVKRYADLLLGNITFESALDKGTTFTLTLPKELIIQDEEDSFNRR